MTPTKHQMSKRFRGYYPIVIDLETGGLHPKEHALLELAAIPLSLNEEGKLIPLEPMHFKIRPEPSVQVTEEALKINKIDLQTHELSAVSEREALKSLFNFARKFIKAHGCVRGILAGHNATFDLSFLYAAAERQGLKRNPFHPFSVLDSVSLSAFAYGQTTLKNACHAAGIEFQETKAHTALYDAEKTAALFCHLYERFRTIP